MWPSFQLKNITLYFFSLVCSLFSRYYVCKQRSAFQAASFGDLLLNEKQKKPFVSLKDEVTITQSFFTAASLPQVDNAPNKLMRICFVVTLEGSIRDRWNPFFLFCFSSSFKNLLRVFVIELPFLLVRIWMICFLASIVRRLLARIASITSITQIQSLPVN